MNLGIRAILYSARKWKKTLLVFCLLLAITTLVLSGLAIADAQEEQAEEVRGTTGASFTVERNLSTGGWASGNGGSIILRPICVMALSIFPLFFIRLAVGRLHPNNLAMPSIPYTYFLSVSVTGCGCASVWLEACLLRNMNSSPVICQTGFNNNS